MKGYPSQELSSTEELWLISAMEKWEPNVANTSNFRQETKIQIFKWNLQIFNGNF